MLSIRVFTWILVALKQFLCELSQQIFVTSWSTTLRLRWRPALSALALLFSAHAFFGFVCEARFLFCWIAAFRGGICRDPSNAVARERVNRQGSSWKLAFIIFSFLIFTDLGEASKNKNKKKTKTKEKEKFMNPARNQANKIKPRINKFKIKKKEKYITMICHKFHRII